MGIRDRDYMKRPSDDDDQDGSSSESKAEEFAQKLLKKNSRLILFVGIGLGILIVIALLVAKYSGASQ